MKLTASEMAERERPVSLVSDEMMNTFSPTGGVISPSSTTISANIPNQILRSSVLMP